ncbi:MAG: Smr/MutS family protein [Rhodobacterales bacterium]|nr:Smr/MutS family protein [Rhodobacterales bacterium]
MGSRGRHPGQKGLSPEDRDLWRHVTRDVEPLRRVRHGPEKETRPEAPPPPPVPLKAKRSLPLPKSATAPPPPDLDRDRSAPGLDRRTSRRLKHGRLDIDARIDLHGLSQTEAHRALDAFIGASHAAGRRCVLVITGKGTREREETRDREVGVLRRAVPHWLNLPPNRSRVLAFSHAAPRHGGEGALYVMLRKSG